MMSQSTVKQNQMRNKSTNYYCISDTHFGHDKLVKDGFKTSNEDEKVLMSINDTVKENDILIHIGDVSFYRDDYWHNHLFSSCSGRMILVRGNHDKKSITWYYKHGWDFVCDEFKLNIYGEKLVFTHHPIITSYDEMNLCNPETYTWTINIHGHLHGDNHRGKFNLPDCNILVYNNLINLKTLVNK